MIRRRLLLRKPLLIRLLKNPLPDRNPAPSVPPPVKDLLGSGLLDSARTVSVPLVNGQTVSVLPDSGQTVSVLPDSAPMVSIPPVVQPQFTRRRKRSIPR